MEYIHSTLVPVASGSGQIVFDIKYEIGESQIVIDNIYDYEDTHDAIHEAEEKLIADPNGIVFTKEQSWKVDFATAEVSEGRYWQGH